MMQAIHPTRTMITSSTPPPPQGKTKDDGSTSRIYYLPREIIQKIMSYLDMKDVKKIRMVKDVNDVDVHNLVKVMVPD